MLQNLKRVDHIVTKNALFLVENLALLILLV